MAARRHKLFLLLHSGTASPWGVSIIMAVSKLAFSSAVGLFFVIGNVHGASGYLKPEVPTRVLNRAEGYFQEGVELYRGGNYRAALRKFMAAERACPELFAAGYHVAVAHRKMGNEDAAMAQLKKLNAQFPENVIAHNDLGAMYAGKNKEELDTLAQLEFDMAVRNGENLLRGKERKVPQVRIDLAMAYANSGGLQLKNNKLSDAEKSFRKAIEHHPRAFYGHFGLGNVLFAMGRFDEAKAPYRKAEQAEPSNDNVHIVLAKCYLLAQEKNPRFAIAELRKVRGETAQAEVFELSGDAYALLGNRQEAIENYTKHLKLKGHDPQVLYKIGAIYYNSGDYAQAKKRLQEFVKGASEGEKELLATAHKLLGDIASAEKDYEKAVASYLQGTKVRDAYFSCYYGLADAYFCLKDYEKAREYISVLLKGLPKSGNTEENELREKALALLKSIPSER